MRWAGHVARVGNKGNAEFWWGTMKKREHLQDRGIDGTLY
jgi:hypothetical protein